MGRTFAWPQCSPRLPRSPTHRRDRPRLRNRRTPRDGKGGAHLKMPRPVSPPNQRCHPAFGHLFGHAGPHKSNDQAHASIGAVIEARRMGHVRDASMPGRYPFDYRPVRILPEPSVPPRPKVEVMPVFGCIGRSMRCPPRRKRMPPFSGVLGVRPNQTDRNPSALGSRIDESPPSDGLSGELGLLDEQIRISNQIRAQYRTDHIEQTGAGTAPASIQAWDVPGFPRVKKSRSAQAPPWRARSACSICSNRCRHWAASKPSTSMPCTKPLR